MRFPLLTFALLLPAVPLLQELQEPQQQLAAVDGIVVELGTGRPVAGARVDLMPAPPAPVLGRGPLTAPVSFARSAFATTTEDGRFFLNGVIPGSYRLVTSAGGYIANQHAAEGARPGTPITLAPRQAMSGVVIRLTPTGAISGRVTDPAGRPLQGAAVYALRYVYEEGRRLLVAARDARSGADGTYELKDVRPGRYFVSAVPGGAGTIPVYFPGTTDASGAVPIDMPPAGVVQGLDFTAAAVRTVAVRGYVVNATTGRPPETVTVILFHRNPVLAQGAIPRSVSVTNGYFEFGDVPPGPYDLVAAVNEYAPRLLGPDYRGYIRFGGRIGIDVGDRDIEGVPLMLRPGLTIRGRIVREGGIDGTTSASQPHITLDPVPPLPNISPAPARVSADGTFTVSGVVAGEYRLAVTNTGPRIFVKQARIGGTDALGPAFRIDGPASPLEIVLSGRSGTLAGLILDRQEEPVSGATVVLIPEPPERDNFYRYWPTTSGPAGRFRMDGVVPGDYKVFAWESAEGQAWQDPDFLRAYEHLGYRVYIGEDAVEEVRLRVIAAEERPGSPPR